MSSRYTLLIEWHDGHEYVSPTKFKSIKRAESVGKGITRGLIKDGYIKTMHIKDETGKHVSCFNNGKWTAK